MQYYSMNDYQNINIFNYIFKIIGKWGRSLIKRDLIRIETHTGC